MDGLAKLPFDAVLDAIDGKGTFPLSRCCGRCCGGCGGCCLLCFLLLVLVVGWLLVVVVGTATNFLVPVFQRSWKKLWPPLATSITVCGARLTPRKIFQWPCCKTE